MDIRICIDLTSEEFPFSPSAVIYRPRLGGRVVAVKCGLLVLVGPVACKALVSHFLRLLFLCHIASPISCTLNKGLCATYASVADAGEPGDTEGRRREAPGTPDKPTRPLDPCKGDCKTDITILEMRCVCKSYFTIFKILINCKIHFTKVTVKYSKTDAIPWRPPSAGNVI